jgi:L-threonylcarbamoyladenylate synthase
VSRDPSTPGDAGGRATERLGPDAAGLARAAELLAAGRLVAFPTETVYGLGADGRDDAAVARLYAAKERPRFNPLIAHLADVGAARREGVFDAAAEALAAAFWPGPLTLVLPAAPTCSVCHLARAGLDSVALRVPSHELARPLLQAAGFPVVAPSANRSGRISPTEAAHVLSELDGRIDAVVEGGPTRVGIESTIVSCLGPVPMLLRPGGVAREAIEAVLRAPLAAPGPSGAKPVAPGALASHYAPHALVRLEADAIQPGEAALLFGAAQPPGLEGAVTALNLSPAGDLAEAAAHLFGHLRRLDASGAKTIAVAPIPAHGLGEGINDRLQRAAAER